MSTRAPINFEICEDLQKELSYIAKLKAQERCESDAAYALELNAEEYENEGQLIGCEICMDDHPFESMVHCHDGHLFCAGCVKSWIEETVYGNATTELKCLNADCEFGFPRAQLERTLTPEELKKLDAIVQDVEIQRAGVKLKYCPFCPYKEHLGYEPDPVKDMGTKKSVFQCLNPACKKASCLLCNKEDHLPKECYKILEDSTRKNNEEALSNALIRYCSNKTCSQALIKEEGCNRVYCPKCRTNTCYVCRIMLDHQKPYEHFCRCSRAAVDYEKCPKCKGCPLFYKDTIKLDTLKVKKVQDTLDKENKEAFQKKIVTTTQEDTQKDTHVTQVTQVQAAPKEPMPFLTHAQARKRDTEIKITKEKKSNGKVPEVQIMNEKKRKRDDVYLMNERKRKKGAIDLTNQFL
eukprot:TRINITY_DN6575_c0_g1_i2.p1 TRINITY_DN6575_c0_g1~~TRINITY_DN6575_c0_g1_i2.p1  ORF type:complete len:408 (+),score=52.94 TRINITY_DN6575_c0_g1_i2:683-1906(+)